MIHWIVVSDTLIARIFASVDGRSFAHVRDLAPEMSNAHHADHAGRLAKGKGTAIRSAMEPHSDAQTVELQRFTHKIGEFLHAAWTKHEFHELAVVAPPKCLGALRNELDRLSIPYLHSGVAHECTSLETHQLHAYLLQELNQWFREAPQAVGQRAVKSA